MPIRYPLFADSLQNDFWKDIPEIAVSDWEASRVSSVLLRNEAQIIPFQDLEQQQFFLLTLGEELPEFEKYLHFYAPFKSRRISQLADAPIGEMKVHSPIILALNKARYNAYTLRHFLNKFQAEADVVVVNFSELSALKEIMEEKTILHVPDTSADAQMMAAQMLFGGVAATGGLTEEMKTILGVEESRRTEANRLAYVEPEHVGLMSDQLAHIDTIVKEAISKYAMPGCQILIARKGKVFFHKAFGYHTYERQQPVDLMDLYDIASITKVAATTLAAMKLYEDDKYRLDEPLRQYFDNQTYTTSHYKVFDTVSREVYLASIPLTLPDSLLADSTVADSSISDSLVNQTKVAAEPDTTALGDSLLLVGRWVKGEVKRHRSQLFRLQARDLMTHTSGLQAGLPVKPFQRRYDRALYRKDQDQNFGLKVANGLFLRTGFQDSLWNLTKSLYLDSARYRYSCVNMILMQQLIDTLNQAPIDQYLSERFYHQMGMHSIGYNPWKRYEETQLVPTSRDAWRGQMLCGTVHDPTAALLGGVSGNAGLFSNANDLAILGQMLLNGGHYGGKRFLQDTTVALFTAYQKGHRGYGFDKPPRHNNYYVAPSASLKTFGHTGFTGTCFWVDPEHELVFVFLSNRVHPNEKNYRLNELRVRRRVHQVVYDALGIPQRGPEVKPRLRKEIFYYADSKEETGNSVATVAAP